VSGPVIVDEKAQENGMAVMMADLITEHGAEAGEGEVFQ